MQRIIQIFNLQSIMRPDTGAFALLGAIVAPIINAIYGPGRIEIVMVLLFLIILDWITGIAAAHKHKTYTTEYGIVGICRTVFLLCFPAFSNLLDNAFYTPGFFFYAVTFGLIYHTFNSMTANAYRAGWEKLIPKQMVDFISSEIKAKTDRAAKTKKKDDAA